jgi:hypothetical protein
MTALHPVLAMQWAGMASLPPSPVTTPSPTTGTGASFVVGAYVITYVTGHR